MSYIQVEIGGKPRGLKFNKMAHLELEGKIKKGNLMSGVYGLVWGGLVANCYVKGDEPDFTFEQVCDWTDELSDDTLLQIQSAFQDTEAYKKGQAYKAELEKAKKKDDQPNPLKNTKQKALK